jgi:hypothetical protein
MVGVWIAPVTAQVMMTFPCAAAIFVIPAEAGNQLTRPKI